MRGACFHSPPLEIDDKLKIDPVLLQTTFRAHMQKNSCKDQKLVDLQKFFIFCQLSSKKVMLYKNFSNQC